MFNFRIVRSAHRVDLCVFYDSLNIVFAYNINCLFSITDKVFTARYEMNL